MKDTFFSIKNIWNRFWSQTPTYWKQVRNLMATLATIAGALILYPNTPEVLIEYCKYIATVGYVLAMFAQTATTTPSNDL